MSPENERQPPAGPVLAMSSLGQIGRFGYQILQYAALRILAERSGARVECPNWDGRQLFGLDDPEVRSQLTPAIEAWESGESLFHRVPELVAYIESISGKASVPVGVEALERGVVDVDLWGHFQWHTRHFARDQEFLRKLFEPADTIRPCLDEAVGRLRARGRTIVGIHLRRADFGNLPLLGFTFATPFQWWREWLEKVWRDHDDPVLFVCSDDLRGVDREFEEFGPVTSIDLGASLPGGWDGMEYYPDFHLLSQCDVVGISNSTFSFAAALLNRRARQFVRAHWDPARRIIPFDPWDSPPLLYVGNECPRVFKGFGEALRIEYHTQGVSGVLKCVVNYPVAWMKIRFKRFSLAFQAGGSAAVMRSLLRL